MKIYAINRETKEKKEITDLFWFEEEGVRDFGGEGNYEKYDFVLEIKGDNLSFVLKSRMENY